jgi:calcineurin-like phosphoesterase family protein
LRWIVNWLFSSSRPQGPKCSIPPGAKEPESVLDVDSPQDVRAAAVLPPGVRIYAIGDIHGRADLLRTLLGKVDADRKSRPVDRSVVVFLGDYIDRGPSSKDVLDILLDYRASFETIFLKGNHEKLAVDFLQNPSVIETWRSCGGFETLLSYGLKPSLLSSSADERLRLSREFAECMPTEHRRFLMSLQLYFQCGEFLFVHAGIRPKVRLRDQDEKDLLWIRDAFLEYEKPFELFVVHGHTPVHAPDMQSNRLNIDTGAFATGRLTCVAIEGSMIRLLST